MAGSLTALEHPESHVAADELADAIAPSFMCQPPLIQTCTDGAPRMSGLGDGICWYRAQSCPVRTSAACDAVPVSSFDDGLRLCPCVPSGRRLDGIAPLKPLAKAVDPLPPDVTLKLPVAASSSSDAPAAAADDAPCDDEPQLVEEKPKMHGAGGGNPLRCPNVRKAREAAAARCHTHSRRNARPGDSWAATTPRLAPRTPTH